MRKLECQGDHEHFIHNNKVTQPTSKQSEDFFKEEIKDYQQQIRVLSVANEELRQSNLNYQQIIETLENKLTLMNKGIQSKVPVSDNQYILSQLKLKDDKLVESQQLINSLNEEIRQLKLLLQQQQQQQQQQNKEQGKSKSGSPEKQYQNSSTQIEYQKVENITNVEVKQFSTKSIQCNVEEQQEQQEKLECTCPKKQILYNHQTIRIQPIYYNS